jgi:hypothetical protein
MDTLVIVRKIREAETLADSGDHGGAQSLLGSLLDDQALTDAHRELIARKLKLFDKQRQRMTRLNAHPDESSELTAIIEPTDSERRPTDVLKEEATHGVPTEVVPKRSAIHGRAIRIPTLKRSDLDPDAAVDHDTHRVGTPKSTRRDTEKSGPLPEVPAPGPTKPPTGNYFGRRTRSGTELMALVDQLPEDDLRRELAYEVVKLRDEVERIKSTRSETPARSFEIPASQVNTIVRTAAGTQGINVHMPAREEEATELKVLRKDSVRTTAAPPPPATTVEASHDLIDATEEQRPAGGKRVVLFVGFALLAAALLIGIGMVINALMTAG